MDKYQKFTIDNDVRKIDVSEWGKLLEKSATSSVFQSPEMYEFFEGVNGFQTFVFSVSDDSGTILALMSGVILKEGTGMKAKMTRRAVIFGGPLLAGTPETQEALTYLLENINKFLAKNAIYAETRNLNDYSAYQKAFEKAGWEYHPHLNFHVDCSDEAAMKKRVSKSKMRQIRKSLRTGAEIIESNDIEGVREFYDVLNDLYKTKVKTPLPDFEFFEKFFYSKLGKYLLIRYDAKIVGGIMCPILPGKVIYEWYVCGLDGEIKDVYPSILATWAAMDYAVKKGIKRFDFMGAGAPDKDYGVREFKSKFGGELVEYGRFFKIYKPALYQVGKTGVKILKSIK